MVVACCCPSVSVCVCECVWRICRFLLKRMFFLWGKIHAYVLVNSKHKILVVNVLAVGLNHVKSPQILRWVHVRSTFLIQFLSVKSAKLSLSKVMFSSRFGWGRLIDAFEDEEHVYQVFEPLDDFGERCSKYQQTHKILWVAGRCFSILNMGADEFWTHSHHSTIHLRFPLWG